MTNRLLPGVCCGIKFVNYKNDWILLKTRKSSKILTHRAVLAVLTFNIKLLSPRVPESLAANRECSEIHERIREFLETFLIVNLHNTQNIWQHHREFREEKELRKVGAKNHCNQYLFTCFSVRAREKCPDDKNCLMSMTNHAAGIGTCTQGGMTIPSHPSSEMRLGKSPDHTEFHSWTAKFRTEVCSKAKNPTLALQWIRKSKQLNRLMTSSLQNHFPDYEELDLMMAAGLKRCYDKQTRFRKKISVEEQRTRKGQPISQRETHCLYYRDCSVLNWRTTTFRILI